MLYKRTINCVIFFFTLSILTGQPYQIDFSIQINDSILVKGKRKESVKMNISFVRKMDDSSSIEIEGFERYLHSAPYLIDSNSFKHFTEPIKKSKFGFIFLIEETDGVLLPAGYLPFISFTTIEGEIEYSKKRYVVDEKRLKIEHKCLRQEEDALYKSKKITIRSNENKLDHIVFPLLDIYYDLPKGEYYIYLLYYSGSGGINFEPSSEIWGKNKPLIKSSPSYIYSNKVKLIVE